MDCNLFTETKKVLEALPAQSNAASYQSLRKLNAELLLQKKQYFEAAFNLLEALAPSVRTAAIMKCEKIMCNKEKRNMLNICSDKFNAIFNNIDPSSLDEFCASIYKKVEISSTPKTDVFSNEKCLPKDYMKYSNDDTNEMVKLKSYLDELPKEWTIIQLTATYEACEQWKSLREVKSNVKEFYITVLKSRELSREGLDPYTAKIIPEEPKYSERPLFEELYSILEENKLVIGNNLKLTNNSVSKYWEKRNDCNLRMKSLITNMNKKWLSFWRCLLSGCIESEELSNSIREIIKDNCESLNVCLSSLQFFLLYSLINAAHFISLNQASLFLRKIYLYNSEVSAESIHKCEKYILFRKTFMDLIDDIQSEKHLKELKNAQRQPVVFLLDEKLDIFPWEVLPILSGHPVTRFECFHILYSLFKKYQSKIVNGYLQVKPNVGRYLINPGGDLNKMEKRMHSFIDYWCPQWKGEINVNPQNDSYEKFLQESDIFLYCGHGDGSGYIGCTIEKLEKLRSVAILSGCGSVSLFYPGPQILPIPIHSQFHMANCPSIVGMLWEVTDLEIDKVTSMLLALFLPSKAVRHWIEVDQSKWTQGIINPEIYKKNDGSHWEPDLLKALAKSRNSSLYTTISASIVARGLPVQIIR